MNRPKIAVIIPVHDNPDGIRATLDSLVDQATAYAHQIIVVDNNSTDDTLAVVRPYEIEHDHVTLVQETNIQSSYAARNTGIRSTGGDIFIFLDADVCVPNKFLDTVIQNVQSKRADYMGCAVDLPLPNEPSAAALYDHHTGFPVQRYIQEQQFAPTCCLVVRRAVFEEVGLFDERLISGGDKEFGNRVHAAGYRLHYADDVTASHPPRSTTMALIRKELRVGRGICQLQRYYPGRFGAPGVAPRPSGVRSVNNTDERFLGWRFILLGMLLTLMRGIGYYREYVWPGEP